MQKPANKSAQRKRGFEHRHDWVMFSGLARMRVWVSGGPIHAPHDPVLQLLIKPWDGDDESWTVYRHENGAQKPGKIVFKTWDQGAEKKRFRALGKKAAPRSWRDTANVAEKQYTVPGRWVRALERRIEALSVPPMAGAVRPLARETEFTLSLWRSRQKATFSWNPTPPAQWLPIANLFRSLLKAFRRHGAGKPMVNVDKL